MNTFEELLLQILREPDTSTAVNLLGQWLENEAHGETVQIFLNSTQSARLSKIHPAEKTASYRESKPHVEIVARRATGGILGKISLPEHSATVRPEALEALLDELYRRKYVATFLEVIKKPLDFTNQDNYFNASAKLLSDALSMEMVAIRQLNSANNLHCRAFYRYPEKHLLGIDFDGGDLPPPFQELIQETQAAILNHTNSALPIKYEIVSNPPLPRHQFLAKSEEISGVKGFAMFPIVFAGEFFGIVSCSTTSDLTFSSLEKATISTAMQLISISVSNFVQYHEARRMTENLHDNLFTTTEIEIAKSASHELQNVEAEQVLQLDELATHLKDAKDRVALALTEKLQESTDKLDRVVAKLRYSAIHTSPIPSQTSIQFIWEEAINLMHERLRMEQIRLRYVGPPLEGEYYADWIREALLNLVLNSIDAFRDRPKQNRNISLVIQKDSEASQYYILDYSDTAGGIQYSKLLIPQAVKESNPDLSLDELLFQPKVSTKKRNKGAGWGLYLVRQALRLHGGSVSLRTSNRDGVTFRIQLRKSEKKGLKR